jgi:hypothetical protein
VNKFKTIVLSILGGIDVTISIFTPVILAALYVTIFGLIDWKGYFFYGIGLLATLFRAIKVGWLKQ